MESVQALARQNPDEELANSVTHGIGALLSAGALTVMVALAGLRGSTWHVIGCAVFGGSLVTLYVASTLYHGLPHGRSKAILRDIEHVCIYLLIAGSYTPWMLTVIGGGWGRAMLGLVWGIALAGAVFKILFAHRYPFLTVASYVAMGWVAVIAAKPMIENIPLGGLLLIVSGGLCYTGGLFFFMLDQRFRFFHTLWHLCVLAGSACHVLAVIFYVLP